MITFSQPSSNSSKPFNPRYMTYAYCLGVLGVMMQYGFGLGFFFAQAQLIHEVVVSAHHEVSRHLALLIVCVVGTKLAMILGNLIRTHTQSFTEAHELKYQFTHRFPQRIYKDYADSAQPILNAFVIYIPKWVRAQYELVINRVAFGLLFGLVIVLSYIQHFYLGLCLSLIIMALTLSHQWLYNGRIERAIRGFQGDYQALAGWIKDYFKGYKEISKAWREQVVDHQWLQSRLTQYSDRQRRLNETLLTRDTASQLVIELPFLLVTVAMLLAVYKGAMPFAMAFVWIGLSQNLLSVAQGMGRNVEHKNNRDSAYAEISKAVQQFETAPKHPRQAGDVDGASTVDANENCHGALYLRDGTEIKLGAEPGIYQLFGSNGAGKSTLLDSIIRFDRQSTFHETDVLKQIQRQFDERAIRLIEREPAVFQSMATFEAQVLGPNHSGQPDHALIRATLGSELWQRWQAIYQSLKHKFESSARYDFSSGEKVKLSCLRCLHAWDQEVGLLIVDECDSVLDINARALFHDSLKAISRYYPVYYVAHHHELQAKAAYAS